MANSAWVLPIEVPIGSYRELVALKVSQTMREQDSLADVHARFCARLKCPACGLTAICTHRDRVADIRLIFSMRGGQ